jgi:proton glutamate symport protein
MTSKKRKSPWLVIAVIILAFFVGNLTGKESGIFGVTFYSIFDLIGTLFIRALTLIVVPLVLSSIVSGVSRVGGDKAFKSISIKTLAFYVTTTLSAVIIGLLYVNLFEPGNSETLRLSVQAQNLPAIGEHITGQDSIGITDLILSIVPSNILEALSKGEMLALIFFSLIFGYSLSKTTGEGAQVVKNAFQGLFDTMIRVTQVLMKCLPLGVFCLVAKVAASTGFSSLSSLALFFATTVMALLTFSLGVIPLLLKFVAKVNPLTHFKAVAPALLTSFSTSSSSAALPVTIDCVEKRAGVSNRICSLVIPLGNSLNMSGSALYECVGALFIAQIYGLELTFSAQVIFVLLALMTSMGVAGIPAASLVAIVVILKAFGLPAEGIGLFLAVDRILDMCRSTVNTLSDSCCAVLVAKSEGETGILTTRDFDIL